MKAFSRVTAASLLIFLFLLPFTDLAYPQRSSRRSSGGQSGPMTSTPFKEPIVPVEFDNKPFDVSTTSLPRFYVGYEPQLLYNNVGAEKAGQSLRTYAVRYSPVEVSYDADKGALLVYCALSPVLDKGSQDPARKSFIVKRMPLMDNRYITVDSHGKKIEIEEIKFREYAIAVSNLFAFPHNNFSSNRNNPGSQKGLPIPDRQAALDNGAIVAAVPLTPSESKSLQEKLAALLVFSPTEPYVTTDAVREKPTTERFRDYSAQYFYIHARLVELWVYDFTSGKVLSKLKPRKTVQFP